MQSRAVNSAPFSRIASPQELATNEIDALDAAELDRRLNFRSGKPSVDGDHDSLPQSASKVEVTVSDEEDDFVFRHPRRRRYAEAFESDDEPEALARAPRRLHRSTKALADSDDELDLAAPSNEPRKKPSESAGLTDDLDMVDDLDVVQDNVSPLQSTTLAPTFIFQTTRSRMDGILTAQRSSRKDSPTQARMIPSVETVRAPAAVSTSRPTVQDKHSKQSARRPRLVMFATPSQFSTFDLKLGEYVGELFKLGEYEMTPECSQLLRQRTVGEWVAVLGRVTLDDVKTLLDREDPPTVNDLLSLSEIDDSHSPGVYIGVILTDRALHDGHDFTYVGSATAPGRGLVYRCNRHLDQNYRNTEKSKGTENYHYAIVDEEGKGRKEHFRKLAETEFEINESEHISEVRFACVVLEQVMMCWTHSLATTTANKFPGLVKLALGRRLSGWVQTDEFLCVSPRHRGWRQPQVSPTRRF